MTHWKTNFLTGLAVVLPALLSIGAVLWLFGTVANSTDALLFFLPKDWTHERAGLYSVGFITGAQHGEVQCRTREEVVGVFVPTTPNPTTGFIVLVPPQQVIKLDFAWNPTRCAVKAAEPETPMITRPPANAGGLAVDPGRKDEQPQPSALRGDCSAEILES